MAVPAEIRAVPRHVNTIVDDNSSKTEGSGEPEAETPAWPSTEELCIHHRIAIVRRIGKLLFHVSFDIVENFTPRIPPDWARMEGENATIPRICVAKNIADCLNGMPLAGETAKKMEALGIPVIIHVYEFEAERPYVMSNKEVSVYVPDAELTGEMWILSHGKLVGRTDYELTNIKYKETRLFLAERCFITKFDAKKVGFSDNVRNLMDRVGYVEENRELVYGMMVEKSFTSVINAMYKDFLEILERKKPHAEN